MPSSDSSEEPEEIVELTRDEFNELFHYFSERTQEGKIVIMLSKILYRHAEKLRPGQSSS